MVTALAMMGASKKENLAPANRPAFGRQAPLLKTA